MNVRGLISKVLRILGAGSVFDITVLTVSFFLLSLFDVVCLNSISYYLKALNQAQVLGGIDRIVPHFLLHVLSGYSFIVCLSISIFFLYVVKSLSFSFMQKKIIKFSYGNAVKIKNRLILQFQENETALISGKGTSYYVNQFQNQVDNFATSALQPLLQLLASIIVVTVMLSYLLFFYFESTILLVLAFGGFAILYWRFCKPKILKASKVGNVAWHNIASYIQKLVKAGKEIKLYRKESFFRMRAITQAEQYAEATAVVNFYNYIPRFMFETTFVSFVLLFTVVTLAHGQGLTALVPVLGVLAAAGARLVPVFAQIMTSISSLSYASDYVRCIDLALSSKFHAGEKNDDSMSLFSPAFEAVEFLNVGFKYGAGKYAIRNLNLRIEKNKTYGIFGGSGAGKSTLVNLLMGFITPDDGEIVVDGISIKRSLKSWHSNLAYIPQDDVIFDATIRENITLTEGESIDATWFEHVVRMSELGQLIARLPENENTQVGEEGSLLSGGEKQRVALARALYFDRSVIIMDEATSALDNETEKSIVDTLQKLKSSKTMIIVAHRLSTLSMCDEVIELQSGSIKRKGRYNDIILPLLDKIKQEI